MPPRVLSAYTSQAPGSFLEIDPTGRIFRGCIHEIYAGPCFLSFPITNIKDSIRRAAVDEEVVEVGVVIDVWIKIGEITS